jgi:ethanolamine utilization cobalamin adenosyltransferase
LSSFKELQPAASKPVAFVCEEDVRVAIDSKSHIVLGRKTIVTPSARELGEAHDVFVIAD